MNFFIVYQPRPLTPSTAVKHPIEMSDKTKLLYHSHLYVAIVIRVMFLFEFVESPRSVLLDKKQLGYLFGIEPTLKMFSLRIVFFRQDLLVLAHICMHIYR